MGRYGRSPTVAERPVESLMTPGPNPTTSRTLPGTSDHSETPKRDPIGVSCNSEGDIRNISRPVPRVRSCRTVVEVSDSWVTTTFRRPITESEHQVGTRSAPGRHQVGTRSAPGRHQVGTKSAPSRHQVEILRNCLTEKAIAILMASAGGKDRTKFRNQVLKPLLDAGWLEMTIP